MKEDAGGEGSEGEEAVGLFAQLQCWRRHIKKGRV